MDLTPEPLTPEKVLRYAASALTGLAVTQPEGSELAARIMTLVGQLDDTRLTLCTCGQPWKGHPQPHSIACVLLRPVKPCGCDAEPDGD